MRQNASIYADLFYVGCVRSTHISILIFDQSMQKRNFPYVTMWKYVARLIVCVFNLSHSLSHSYSVQIIYDIDTEHYSHSNDTDTWIDDMFR